MNSIQRRLFRAFAEVGGDLTEDIEVERFIRYVEGNLLLLPPKVREATELVWRCKDSRDYVELSAEIARRDPTAVTPATLRQRVSRGVRVLESAVRQRTWRQPAVNGATAATTHGDRAAIGGYDDPSMRGGARRKTV